jgi:hypothetical protein
MLLTGSIRPEIAAGARRGGKLRWRATHRCAELRAGQGVTVADRGGLTAEVKKRHRLL